MNLLTKLRHALLGRPQPKVTRLDGPDATAMRIDELPPFNLHIADLMRYDPQVRIGLGARNGLLMAAQVEVVGPQNPRTKDQIPKSEVGGRRSEVGGAVVGGGSGRAVRWVQHQWDALWHSAAHQLLRAKLYGFLPFEVVYRQAAAGPFGGLIEVERLVDYHPRDARLLVQGDKVVGFSYEGGDYSRA